MKLSSKMRTSRITFLVNFVKIKISNCVFVWVVLIDLEISHTKRDCHFSNESFRDLRFEEFSISQCDFDINIQAHIIRWVMNNQRISSFDVDMTSKIVININILVEINRRMTYRDVCFRRNLRCLDSEYLACVDFSDCERLQSRDLRQIFLLETASTHMLM